MVMAEVKKAFNPEFLNRLDEVILFTSLSDEDLLKIVHMMVEQVNLNLVAKQIKIQPADDAARYILEKTCATAAMAPVRCAGRCRSSSRIRCRTPSSRDHCPALPNSRFTSGIPVFSVVRSRAKAKRSQWVRALSPARRCTRSDFFGFRGAGSAARRHRLVSFEG